MSKRLLESGAIIQLKKQFSGRGQVKGFKFTQISTTDKAFLYKVDTGNQIHYEVFKKVINKRYNCISYPTSRAFGIWAWTTSNKERAFEILNDLTRNEEQK